VNEAAQTPIAEGAEAKEAARDEHDKNIGTKKLNSEKQT